MDLESFASQSKCFSLTKLRIFIPKIKFHSHLLSKKPLFKFLCILVNFDFFAVTKPSEYFQNMTMMFEVADLAVASPATVSRCGMVYLEPSILGLQPFVECWLKKLPDAIYSHRPRLEELFTIFLEVSTAT